MKLVVNLLVIDRPKTTERCIKSILKTTDRSKFTWVVSDQNSNEETKEVLYRYRKDFDVFKEWTHNIGCNFGINFGMSHVQSDQHFMDINSDVCIYSDDWFDILEAVAKEPDIGVVAGRRPEFWIDSYWKYDLFCKEVIPEERNGIWCEFMRNSLIVGPFWLIKKRVIDKVGYMNEANGYDDVDYYHRVHETGLKSCYVPLVSIRQPQDEEQHHPQYGSHMALLQKNQVRYQNYVNSYAEGKDLYCGTRFLPDTMKDYEYSRMSDENWEFLKNWRKS